MTDWRKVFAYEKYSYVKSFPATSFLLSGVSFYQDTIKNVKYEDILDMEFESNKYDTNAIVIKKDGNICGYVKRDEKEKVNKYVPSKVQVIDKCYVKDNIFSLRVDIYPS